MAAAAGHWLYDLEDERRCPIDGDVMASEDRLLKAVYDKGDKVRLQWREGVVDERPEPYMECAYVL